MRHARDLTGDKPPKSRGVLLEEERAGVHLHVGFARDVELVGERERNFGLPHLLLVGVVWRKRVFTWAAHRVT